METLTSLIEEAISLMVLGMGFVFIFLGLLIFAMSLLRRIAGNVTDIPPASVRTSPMPPPSPSVTDPHLVAAISAAVHAHRRRGQ